MLETFESAHSRDFRQRYNNSFGFFTNDAKRKILVYMVAVGERDVSFQDEKGANYVAHADAGVEFEFIPIQKRLFVLKDRLMLIRRRPARQWARGINAQNTYVGPVDTSSSFSSGVHLGFPEVKAATDTTPIDVLHSVRALEAKKVNSITLSMMFGVQGTGLYLYDHKIGSFMVDSREIVIEEKMFKQEVEDLVVKHGLAYKVVEKNG